MIKKQFPFFSHQREKIITVNQALRDQFGDYPTVNVLMHSEDGTLSPEVAPVKYFLDETDTVTAIVVETSNKNGLIIIS